MPTSGLRLPGWTEASSCIGAMVSQRAVFVDAGFLLVVGGTQVVGRSLPSAFRVDYGKLIEGIMRCTEEHSGVDHPRTYWNDASKDALFTDQHKQIGLLHGVKVRLGRISFNGEQKGVDLKPGLDLAGVADPAHRLGVMSVAEHLALRVDRIVTLPAELIEECFTRIVKDAPRPVPAPSPVSSDTVLAGHPVPQRPAEPGAPMAIQAAPPYARPARTTRRHKLSTVPEAPALRRSRYAPMAQ